MQNPDRFVGNETYFVLAMPDLEPSSNHMFVGRCWDRRRTRAARIGKGKL